MPLIPISSFNQASGLTQTEKAELFLNMLSLTSVTICDFLTTKRIVQQLTLQENSEEGIPRRERGNESNVYIKNECKQ